MILQDQKHLALADQLSILAADANSQNHLHARDWAMWPTQILLFPPTNAPLHEDYH